MKWHYTTGRYLVGILKYRELRPEMIGADGIEFPAVWFSTRDDWEPTATKWLYDFYNREYRRLSLTEMQTADGGLFRIGVADHTAPFNWDDFKRQSGISEATASLLVTKGRQFGASDRDWFVSFVPVPASYWLSVEMLRDGHWGLFDYDSRETWGRGRDG